MHLPSFLILVTGSILLSTVAQNVPFDAEDATIASVHNALFTNRNSCREVVSAFIARINALNRLVNAIINLNPRALEEADALDMKMRVGNASEPLFCIPIMLKDNFDAAGMPTTAGSRILNSSFPLSDAPTVAAFRRAGAVILGKTNLHEFALEGLSVSSWGGQTVNPYDFTRTAGGSSGGTGAAIAASFGVFGTGTDTVNSLRSPASANSLYSFRPTWGLISRAGVIPVSYTQDTVGAIGRSLYDIATALTVMAGVGYDPADNATSRIPASVIGKDYINALEPSTTSSLRDCRLGVLHGDFNYTSSDENDPVNNLMFSVFSKLVSAGATLISINGDPIYDANAIVGEMDVARYEFREGLTSYLSSSHLQGLRPKSMPEIFLNSSDYLVIPSQYKYIADALSSSTSNATYKHRLRLHANLTATIHSVFKTHNLDAIIYPEQRNLVVPIGFPAQFGRNGIHAAVTGSPVVTIPIGFSNATATAPIGLPVGMEILGMPWTEDKLLQIAHAIDKRLNHPRRPPVLKPEREEDLEVTMEYETVPVITPSGVRNVDLNAYPTGTFGNC